jgi:Ca2+-binding RTX toxin-like protein
VRRIENLHGSEFADTLTGNTRANVISGFGGADTISGKSGDDDVAGGSGNDTIFGGSGNDTIAGNGGGDDLWGGEGDDTVIGGIGADELHGGSGADMVLGGTGGDDLYGNGGGDDLVGGDGDDDLRGGPGTDRCEGGIGSETAAACEVLTDPYTMDMVLREGWGARDAKPGLIDHEIERITIHHAGTATGTVGAAQFRGWQAYHFSLGWPDVAYHFIVGRDGVVYEARRWTAAGDTATTYDPDGHLLLVVEGNFEEDLPTAGQLESLAIMVAWGAEQFDVPVDEITGHRDHAVTTCPGGYLYAHIVDGSIAHQARDIIDAGGVTLIVE